MSVTRPTREIVWSLLASLPTLQPVLFRLIEHPCDSADNTAVQDVLCQWPEFKLAYSKVKADLETIAYRLEMQYWSEKKAADIRAYMERSGAIESEQ